MSQLAERIAAANTAAMEAFDKAAEAEDATRSDELLAEGTKHAEEAERLKNIEKQRAKVAAAQDRDAARSLSKTPERAFADEESDPRSKADGWQLPTERELEARSVAIDRVIRAGNIRSVPEAVAARATKEWDVENLFCDALRSRLAVQKGGAPTLVGERRKAWDAYCARARTVQERIATPITGGQLAGTDGSGGEFVPETWSMEVIANLAFYGPNANTARLRMFSNNTTGAFHVATVTDNESKKARIVGEAAATTKDRVTTSDKTLNPRNTAVQIPFSDQMLMGGNVNLRGFIESDVPEWFGRAINEWYTEGDGANKPFGIDSIAKTAANRHRIATRATGIVEADIMSWIGLLDKAYGDLPGTSIQFHWDTILKLMQIRASAGAGERIFPLTPDRKSVVIPAAGMAEANNALARVVTSSNTDTVGIYGDLNAYGAIMLGGMSVEFQRELDSFQYLFSWSFYQDGRPLNDNAFAFLANGA